MCLLPHELAALACQRDIDPCNQRRRWLAAPPACVDICAAEKNGVAALHHAVRFRSPRAVQTLIEHGQAAMKRRRWR